MEIYSPDMMDRIDSFLAVIPVMYMVFAVIEFSLNIA